MYYSRAKRQMLFRLAWSSAAVFSFFLVFYSTPWLRQGLCGLGVFSPILTCPSAPSQAWNLFYHLGGNGPWIPRSPTHGEEAQKIPLGCAIDQVHMISRHAERYPTTKAGARHLTLLNRLQSSTMSLKGSLAFLDDWTYFTDVDDPAFENLTTSGPYAGTLQSYNTGKKLKSIYGSLIHKNKTTKFWTCSSPRDVETARWFGRGFFGESWAVDKLAELQIIPEIAECGADTLTPGDTCLKYIEDELTGHDHGYIELEKWQDIFTKPIAERLKSDADGLSFSPLDIYSMMEMCGFEILARGSSPWCEVFTQQEWLHFEYARDLLHFYRAGPGNKYAGAMGWLWLNATTSLLIDDKATGVYFSFVHDGDVVPVLATLGFLNEDARLQHLPSHMVKQKRKWKTSDVVPMGGRIILERVVCDSLGVARNLRRPYIRMFINDGIVDLEKFGLGGGLAQSAGLASWTRLVQTKGEKFGAFKDVCGLSDDMPTKISFLQPQD